MIVAAKIIFCVVVVVVGASASQVRSLTPLSDLTEAFCEVRANRTEPGINMVRWYFYFISLVLQYSSELNLVLKKFFSVEFF